MTTEQREYDYGIKAHGSGFRMPDGSKLERVMETDVLHAMMLEVTACNRAKGWHDVNPKLEKFMEDVADRRGLHDPDLLAGIREAAEAWFGPRTFGDDIALLHSEVSEMLEAFRVTGDARDQTSVDHAGNEYNPKPEGVGAEAADVLVRLLDTCDRYGIDLFAEWRRKVDYNWTRPTRHGGKAL